MQQPVELKLKQASAVLGVNPKDLQNLVQFKVLRPRRKGSIYWFDDRLLLTAKVAFYLKESLGTPTELLARFTEAITNSLKPGEGALPRYIWLSSRPMLGREPVELRVPLAQLAMELKEQLPRAAMHQDLPRGRKRTGWKHEFTRKLEQAARDLSGATESQIAEAIRRHRAEKKHLPEITVGRPPRTP